MVKMTWVVIKSDFTMTGSLFQDPANVGRMISLTNTLNEGDKYLIFCYETREENELISY